MKKLTSQCCGTAIRNVSESNENAICLNCNKPCGVTITIDSAGGTIGDKNSNNFNIH